MASLTLKLAILSDAAKYDASCASSNMPGALTDRADLRQRVEHGQTDLF